MAVGADIVKSSGRIAGEISRRQFVAAAGAMPLVCASSSAAAQEFHGPGFWDRPRYVWMRRPATGEEIRATYWADGKLIPEQYARISWFMRDVQMQQRIDALRASGRTPPPTWYAGIGMSPVLLDILYAFNGWLDHFQLSRAIILNSGHRHLVTNAGTEGAARNSRHVAGGAGDVVIPGVGATSVARFGVWLSAGGVGFYQNKGFTHVDDGRLRVWRG